MAKSKKNCANEKALQSKAQKAFNEKLMLEDAAPVFQSARDAVRFAQTNLSEIHSKTPSDAARAFVKRLDAKTRRSLLSAFLEREAENVEKLKVRRETLYELADDFASGAYPYKHAYPSKLYEKELYALHIELLKLQDWVKRNGKRVVLIFEGRDTAGKGGTIRRFVENLNPRGARVVALAKPTDDEARQWYFQRYAAELPKPGEICLFDRSWYNRGVVEPVMGFCKPEDTELFLSEVGGFELSLVRSGIILIKFWLSISREEQLKRFKERQINPLKRWKLSPVDIASIDKWDDYTQAMERMFKASDTPFAPWTVIRNDDKRRGRLNALRVLLQSVEYDGRNLEHVGAIDPLIVGRSGMLFPSTAEMIFTGAMTAALSSGLSSADDVKKAKRIEKLETEVKKAYAEREKASEEEKVGKNEEQKFDAPEND